MPSPLYESLNQPQRNQNENLMNSFGGPRAFQQRLAAFAEDFRRTANCTPEQKVRQLINSGQMTQAQFNQLSQIANSLVGHR
jgi:hypothetical protein